MSKKNQFTKTDYLTCEEYRKLITGLHEDHDVLGETYARVAKATALRISDVLSLTWSKILSGSFSVVEQKTGKKRTITVPDRTKEVFRGLYKLNGSPDSKSLVFCNRRTGGSYTKQYINRLMKEWKTRYDINVGNFSSHSFRKSFGREFWDKNGRSDEALLKLSYIYNHSSIAVTMIYLGIRDEEISEAYKIIEA